MISSYAKVGHHVSNLGIIGFSLSEHDSYIKQPLYGLINGFQESNVTGFGIEKMPMKIIDCSKNFSETDCLKERYSFVNWKKTMLNANDFTKNHDMTYFSIFN